MKTIIVISIIYLISFVGAYFFIKKAYSKNGKWFDLNPDFVDFLIVILPLSNTILGFMFIFGVWRKDRKKYDHNLSKFFGVKKL